MLSRKDDDEETFNEEKTACKTQNVYILHASLLITITLLIAVSVYSYLEKYLLSFHDTKLKQVYSNKVKDIDKKPYILLFQWYQYKTIWINIWIILK